MPREGEKEVLTLCLSRAVEQEQHQLSFALEKIDGDRVQHVDIYLKFIRKFDPPMPELSEEEIKQQEKAKKRRAYYRERGRRWKAKKKKNGCKSRKMNNKSRWLAERRPPFLF